METTKGKSCMTNVVAFSSGAAPSVGKRKGTGVIYVDCCKAFDMVTHNIFLSKLGRRGLLDGKGISWVVVSRGKQSVAQNPKGHWLQVVSLRGPYRDQYLISSLMS